MFRKTDNGKQTNQKHKKTMKQRKTLVFLKPKRPQKAFNFFSLLLQYKPIKFMFYFISELFYKSTPPSLCGKELMRQPLLSATSFN